MQGLLGEDQDLRPFKVEDYKWVVIDSGYIAYRINQAYYISVTQKRTVKDNELKIQSKPDCVTPINFVLITSDISITNVFGCEDPNKVVIVLSNRIQESIFVVWSLLENKEIRNYSVKGNYVFIRGPSSETGYVLSGFKYVNLDTCIPNYFFDYDFAGFTVSNFNGYQMNQNGKVF